MIKRKFIHTGHAVRVRDTRQRSATAEQADTDASHPLWDVEVGQSDATLKPAPIDLGHAVRQEYLGHLLAPEEACVGDAPCILRDTYPTDGVTVLECNIPVPILLKFVVAVLIFLHGRHLCMDMTIGHIKRNFARGMEQQEGFANREPRAPRGLGRPPPSPRKFTHFSPCVHVTFTDML